MTVPYYAHLHTQGLEFAKRWGVEYMECSALTGEGVTELFEAAARLALVGTGRKKRKFPMLRRAFGLIE